MTTNLSEPNQSTTTLTHATIGKHDGHHDGHLNCVALRHGWSRTFSIAPEELSVLDYHTLETVLEINTLKLRPMGLKVFVEHPPGSGTWAKIRFWKHDTSLQTTLVTEFFEQRRSAGIVTRLDVRDGSDRKDESDAMSLRSVGSRIVQTIHHRAESSTDGSAGSDNNQASGSSWFGLRRRKAVKAKPRQSAIIEDENDEELVSMSDAPLQRPKKVSFLSFFLPRPAQPNHTRRSIFEFFSSKSAEPQPLPSVPMGNVTPSPEQKAAEEENLRKRGWMPPGLARRQRSLRDHLRYGGSSNPFLGGSSSNKSLSKTKKDKGKKHESADPFTDENAAHVDISGVDEDAEMLSEQDVDDFFEVERTISNTSANKDGKLWSRFKPRNKSKSKRRQNVSSSSEDTNSGSRLGGGAQVVSQPMDAFPDSPHRSKTNVSGRLSTDDQDVN